MRMNIMLLLALFLPISIAQRPCAARKIAGADTNIVCVCNSTYCDDIPDVGKVPEGAAIVFTSSKEGQRFQRSQSLFTDQPIADADITIRVEPRKFFQEIIGFGGAFTDAAGINIASVSKKTAVNLLRSYFDQNGLQYTTGRVPIASTDFSTREYSYADIKDDFDLKQFALTEEDLKYKIPYILEALNYTNNGLKLFASPWSAPGWMKTNGRMRGGGSLIESLDGKYHKTWANYFVRFFEEYAKRGIAFWGTTVQNEPSSGVDPGYGWQTMFFNSTTQKDFIKNYLGPSLNKSEVCRNLKIIGLDDNRNLLPSWANDIYSDPIASEFVSGMGIHWYLNHLTPASFLDSTFKKFPNKFILATEACSGYLLIHGPILGDWSRAENYASDIIEDMNHHVSGWTDWNLCLDTVGGPTFVGNNVDAPILVNSTADEFYKQPIYYALAHFSKFVRPGAFRVHSSSNKESRLIQYSAFTHNSKRILVLLNRGGSDTTVSVQDTTISGGNLGVKLGAHSIKTVLWDKI